MGKKLMLVVVTASCLICKDIFGELVLNSSKLAFAIDEDSAILRLAQTAPPTKVNRPILKIGSEGAAVSELQAVLRLLGYYRGSVNGFYGEETAVAVSDFQKAAGLNVDGITGAATWSNLFPSASSAETLSVPSSENSASSFPVPSTLPTTARVLYPPGSNPTNSQETFANTQFRTVDLPVLKKGMQGLAVRRLQERLITLGFLQGQADGVFGSVTQAAVIAAQQSFELEADGIVGATTWSVLLPK